MSRHFTTTRNILSQFRSLLRVRHGGVQYQALRFRFKEPQEREPCPIPPPPPPPPPKDDRYFWGSLALAICTGAFGIFAKYNPEVRDWVSIYAPWFDDLIAIAFEENESWSEFMTCRIEKLQEAALNYMEMKDKECTLDLKGEIVVVGDPNEKKEVDECVKIPPPIVTKDICEIEQCLKDFGDEIVNNYFSAKAYCIYYNKLVLEYMENFTKAKLQVLHDSMDERMELVKTSLDNVAAAQAQLDEITRYFECGVKAPKEVVDNTKALLNEYKLKIKAATMEYEWENDKALALDRQWQMVETLILDFTGENEVLYRQLNYLREHYDIAGIDIDVLLYHTYRYVEMLKMQLAEAQDVVTERSNRALETALPQSVELNKKRDKLLAAAIAKKRSELDKEMAKKLSDLKAANDKRIKDEMKKQLEALQESQRIQVEKKEKEVTAKLEKLVAEKVAEERKKLKNILNEMALKVKRIEAKLNERLKADAEARRSHELYTASSALLEATKKGEPVINVSKEIKSMEKAGDNDKLVTTVLKAIPESVREDGLVPESQLRKKYLTMEKTALKVALVEQDGAPLYVYFLSWLQWVLLCLRLSDIPKEEISKPPKVPETSLDTYDLLLRSRYWIDRGDLEQALVYVGALEGASRAAADSWRRAAQGHLAARLAANAVLAHAAALSLTYLSGG